MADDRLAATAIALSLAGGAVLAAASVVDMPGAVAAGGALAFVLGVVLVGVVGFRSARRGGDGFGRSLWRGVRTLFGWLVDILP